MSTNLGHELFCHACDTPKPAASFDDAFNHRCHDCIAKDRAAAVKRQQVAPEFAADLPTLCRYLDDSRRRVDNLHGHAVLACPTSGIQSGEAADVFGKTYDPFVESGMDQARVLEHVFRLFSRVLKRDRQVKVLEKRVGLDSDEGKEDEKKEKILESEQVETLHNKLWCLFIDVKMRIAALEDRAKAGEKVEIKAVEEGKANAGEMGKTDSESNHEEKANVEPSTEGKVNVEVDKSKEGQAESPKAAWTTPLLAPPKTNMFRSSMPSTMLPKNLQIAQSFPLTSKASPKLLTLRTPKVLP